MHRKHMQYYIAGVVVMAANEVDFTADIENLVLHPLQYPVTPLVVIA